MEQTEDHTPSEHISEQYHKKSRHRKRDLYKKILNQMEFYFGDSNLTKDRFLSNEIKTNPYVDLNVFLRFNKIRSLTNNIKDIAKALKSSTLLKVSEDGLKVCRTAPVQIRDDIDECTIYVERIPPDTTHEDLIKIFSIFGTVQYVSIPKYKHNKSIKGFAFIEFNDVESAEKCLEHFVSIGCKLPSQMPPDKLCSISTFEGDEENPEIKQQDEPETVEKEENVFKDTIKKNDEVIDNKIDEVFEDDTNKKRKISESTDEVTKKLKPDDSEKSKKRKTSETCDENETKKLKTNDVSKNSNEKKEDDEIKSTENVEETSELEDENNETETGQERKKRKRKKRTKRILDIKEMGLQVLSKREWKRLRNKYLDLQRSRMKNLKQQLYRKKYGGNSISSHSMDVELPKEDTNKSKFTLVPGTIVHLGLPESCVDTKNLKMELKSYSSDIKYIDVSEGSFEVYVRFSTNEAAKIFSECAFPAKKKILENEEEKKYWEKAEQDRVDKFNKHLGKPKQRGRDKLLRKAEKALGKHIRFDDTE